MQNLLEEFFIKPIIDSSYRGYNIVNTAVYGTILLIVAFFVVYPLLHKKGIRFDFRFALALFPYILLASGHSRQASGFWFLHSQFSD